jgi:hypothetical protein
VRVVSRISISHETSVKIRVRSLGRAYNALVYPPSNAASDALLLLPLRSRVPRSRQVMISVLLVSHWFACVFALSAAMHSDPLDTYWARNNFCAEIRTDASGFLDQCGLSFETFYIATFTCVAAQLKRAAHRGATHPQSVHALTPRQHHSRTRTAHRART